VSDLAILAVYAHPDDEQGITGTLRRCVENGIRTGILCATRGEVGQIADPALATPETLGAVREQELRRAAAVIGVQHVYFLDYRDSGMAGTPENADSRALVNADESAAVSQISKIIREFKPTVLVTFDESGAYGHPDHIAIQRLTTRAFYAGGEFAPRRLFYSSITRSMIRRMVDYLRAHNASSVFNEMDLEKMGLPDERITNRIDVSRYVALKRQSLNEHKTQNAPDGPFAIIPEELWKQWRSVESFALVAGEPFPLGADPGDLFAGLR
jgi:LmbE family N-acetylglucosaminyl deacetylase